MVDNSELYREKEKYTGTVNPQTDSVLSVEAVLISLSTETVDKLRYFSKELLKRNEVINLTSLKEPDLFWTKNILDSLSPFLFPGFVDKFFCGDLLDLGTGGGFPLVPLSIVCTMDASAQSSCSVQSFVGLDSVKKKLIAVKDVAESVGIAKLQFIHGRAEELGHSGYRESFHTVVSRAVAPLNVLLELISPFVSVGGYAVLYKGPGFLEEMQSAAAILKRLSLKHVETAEYVLPDGQGERALIVFQKVSPLNLKFPRAANVLRKSPLK